MSMEIDQPSYYSRYYHPTDSCYGEYEEISPFFPPLRSTLSLDDQFLSDQFKNDKNDLIKKIGDNEAIKEAITPYMKDIAFIATGSMGRGEYIHGISDIDLIIIIRDNLLEQDQETILRSCHKALLALGHLSRLDISCEYKELNENGNIQDLARILPIMTLGQLKELSQGKSPTNTKEGLLGGWISGSSLEGTGEKKASISNINAAQLILFSRKILMGGISKDELKGACSPLDSSIIKDLEERMRCGLDEKIALHSKKNNFSIKHDLIRNIWMTSTLLVLKNPIDKNAPNLGYSKNTMKILESFLKDFELKKDAGTLLLSLKDGFNKRRSNAKATINREEIKALDECIISIIEALA